MNKYQQKHIITLSNREGRHLQGITKKGKSNAQSITRARVLLQSAHGWKDTQIAEYAGISVRTIENIRARHAQSGINRALYDAPRPGQPPKLDEKAEAHLVALACSEAPKGQDHWTLELLQKRMIRDKKVTSISTVALWKRLKSRGIKPWRGKNVVRSQGNA